MLRLEPLLDDAARVETVSGCIVNPNATVHDVVADAICFSDLPETRSLVSKLAAGNGSHKLFAVGCLGRRDPHAAAVIAHAELGRGPSQSGYVDILWANPLPAACGDLAALATSSSAETRRAVARALGVCATDQALAALDGLSADATPLVARTAKIAVALHARQTAQRREQLLADTQVLHWAAVELELRLRAREISATLPIAEAVAIAHPSAMASALSGLYAHMNEPEVIAMLRRIIATVPPSADGAPDVRAYAIGVLAQNKQALDVVELRRSLTSNNVSEVIDAANALGELHDTASRGLLRDLAGNPNLSVAAAAKRALAKL